MTVFGGRVAESETGSVSRPSRMDKRGAFDVLVAKRDFGDLKFLLSYYLLV